MKRIRIKNITMINVMSLKLTITKKVGMIFLNHFWTNFRENMREKIIIPTSSWALGRKSTRRGTFIVIFRRQAAVCRPLFANSILTDFLILLLCISWIRHSGRLSCYYFSHTSMPFTYLFIRWRNKPNFYFSVYFTSSFSQ